MKRLFLFLLAAPLWAISISAPSAGTISGSVTFTASGAPAGTATVDYWIGGHSIISTLPTSGSYSASGDTTVLADGSQQVVAVARDSGGNITATSAPVTYTIHNSTPTITMSTPSLASALSGTVSFQPVLTDSNGVQAIIYIVDGKYLPGGSNGVHFGTALGGGAYATSFTDSYAFDTTQLTNGAHYLSIGLIRANYAASGNGGGVTAQFVAQFTVSNTVAAYELRAGFRHLYFNASQTTPVQLTPTLIYNDGSSAAQSSTYSSDNTAAATVSSGGLVTPGASLGVANITVTGGGKSTVVRVVNMPNHSGFPHFGKNGAILYSYSSTNSIWVRTLFNTGMWAHLANTPTFPTAAHAAGINAVGGSFYQNPGDSGGTVTTYSQWLSGSSFVDTELSYLSSKNFYLVGQGDDIARNSGERGFSANTGGACSYCPSQALPHAMQQLTGSGRVISLEMQDEVGGAITSDYRTVIAAMKAATGGTPPITWPPAGLQGADVTAAWQGDSTMSDYGSVYWTQATTFAPHYGWGWSLADSGHYLSTTVLTKVAAMQLDKPKYVESYSGVRGYFKRVAGNYYHPYQDEPAGGGFTNEQTTSQVWAAVALGFCGTRMYGYDGTTTYEAQDQGWEYHRNHDPYDSTNTTLQQIGASYDSTPQEPKDRWASMSNAFNLVQTLEPYALSTQINALDLGPDIITGARQLGDGSGRMFVAVNMLDAPQTLTVDLSKYRYSGGSTVARYHVVGLLSTNESVGNSSTATVTMAPGESMVWVFTRPTFTPATPAIINSPIRTE